MSFCRELGTASCGDTIDEALQNLEDAIGVHLGALEETGELGRFLRDRNVKHHSVIGGPTSRRNADQCSTRQNSNDIPAHRPGRTDLDVRPMVRFGRVPLLSSRLDRKLTELDGSSSRRGRCRPWTHPMARADARRRRDERARRSRSAGAGEVGGTSASNRRLARRLEARLLGRLKPPKWPCGQGVIPQIQSRLPPSPRMD